VLLTRAHSFVLELKELLELASDPASLSLRWNTLPAPPMPTCPAAIWSRAAMRSYSSSRDTDGCSLARWTLPAPPIPLKKRREEGAAVVVVEVVVALGVTTVRDVEEVVCFEAREMFP
jgi:hypothetical protein